MIYNHKDNPTVIVNSVSNCKKEILFISKHGRFSSKCQKWVKEALDFGDYVTITNVKVTLTERGKEFLKEIF